MQAFISFVMRRAKWVAIASGMIAIASTVYGIGVFSHLSSTTQVAIENSDSAKARDIVSNRFSSNAPNAIILLSNIDGGKVDTAAFESQAQTIIEQIEQVDGSVTSYYNTQDDSLISRDRTQTSLLVSIPGDDEKNYDTLQTIARNTSSNTIRVDVGGTIAATHQINEQVEHDLIKAELFSLPILAVLLFIIFRSPLATALPLVLGGFSIVSGMALTRLLTHFVTVEQYAINVITILGLGLAIDYSLLMVSRFREELTHHTIEKSIVRTLQTAGRTIIFSGLTVFISLISLVLFNVDFLQSIAYGGAIVVVVAVFGALVILPAILVLIGKYIDYWKLVIVRERHTGGKNKWERFVRSVIRFPIAVTTIVIGLIVLFGWPSVQMAFKGDDWKSLPIGSSSAYVGKSLAKNFERQPAPIEVILSSDESYANARGVDKIADMTKKIEAIPGVARVDSLTSLVGESLPPTQLAQVYRNGEVPPPVRAVQEQTVSTTTARLLVYTDELDPYAKSVSSTVEQIKAINAPGDTTVLVGGPAAAQYDLMHSITTSLPWVLAIMLGGMFVLFVALLRSILLPLITILINCLGLFVSFGIVVWIFQDGHVIGSLQETGGLSVTVPVLVFGIAFGLSMDYSAFLYARMREVYDDTHDMTKAIVDGVRLTGPIITQAAVLLIVVIGAFMLSGISTLQQIGVGLTVSLVIDAFIVRTLLVPAVMKLCGRANWWAPQWLEKFKLSH